MTALVQEIFVRFKARGWTLSLAESCTGGGIAAQITNVPGVSQIFSGAVVAYSNLVKEKCLSVDGQTLQIHGAVSEQTALQMAEGVKKQLQTTWALSVTGVAGPDGGTAKKPVGTACFALSGPKVSLTCTKMFKGDRESVRIQSTQFALQWILENSAK